MKLEIPKPITEIDATNVEPSVVQAAFENGEFVGRNPNYTNSEYEQGNSIGNLEFRRVIIEDCRVEGVIPGATVVHRKIAKDRRIDIITWGVVFGYNGITAQTSVWRPVRVKWLNGSFEDCHATDLIVMNYAPDKGVLQERAKSDRNPSPV